MTAWLWVCLVAAAADPTADGVVIQPAWRPGLALTYTLRRRDTPAGTLATTHPALAGGWTRRFTLRVVRERSEGGVVAELSGLAKAPLTALFDADGSLASISPAGAVSPALRDALRAVFLAGYKRPLQPGGTWADLLEQDRGAVGRYLVDVHLELGELTTGAARVEAAFSWAGPADALSWPPPQQQGEAYVDGLDGRGELHFDLERRLVRRAAYTWRTSLAGERQHGTGGPGYQVMLGTVQTEITLELVPEGAAP
jgi:hypothetical protein